MCKVMVLKGVEKGELALDFMKAVAPNMSLGNTDGIGYAAVNSQNKLFSEKWHNNPQFMSTENVIDKDIMTQLEPFKSRLPNLALNYESTGEVTRTDIRTVTMHTRYATCGKEFANTHPFMDNEMSLIHNGGIANHVALGLNKISTCDSENALQLYNNETLNLQSTPDKFQKFVDQLKGYWAFAFLAKDAEGNYMLDIVREGANLYWALLPELGDDCVVFATTTEIIETGCAKLGLPVRDKIWFLSESNYHRFNAVTGEFIDNFILEESILNYNAYSYYSKKSTKYVKPSTTIEVEEKKPLLLGEEDDGYNSKRDLLPVDGMEDEFIIQNFYDINEPLIDRLFDYDHLMGTSYGNSYEDLPFKVREFISRKEEEDYILFDDVLTMIESYQESGSITGIYKVFKANKRA